MNRALGLLQPKLPAASVRSSRRTATVLFWLGTFAVALQFILPYIVLDAMGVPASLQKFHPATLVIIPCGLYALFAGVMPFHQWMRQSPALVLFVVAMPVLCLYTLFFVGISGSAVFVETFWSAGLLAVTLETATAKQKRLLAGLILLFCVLDVFVGLGESLTQQNLFLLQLDPDAPKIEATVEGFRAHALYNHPLSASLMTAMAIFMLYAMRLPLIVSGPLFSLLLLGLLSFGGRAALGITLILSAATAVFTLFAGIIRRNLKLDFVVAMLIAAIAVPLLIVIIVTQTSIADRILDTLYYDSSAEARATQWEVFRYLTLRNWLFGIRYDDLVVLKYQIGLGSNYTDIENPWILLLLDMGLIGFSVFMAILGGFLYHLGRVAQSRYGWLLILAAFIIDSGSNSLGVKTSDLFLEVAFLIGISGFIGFERLPRATRVRREARVAEQRRSRRGLGPVMEPVRGLRLLRSRMS